MEFYMPRQILESYIIDIDTNNLPRFLKLHPDEDVLSTVKLPPTLHEVYKTIRHKLWNKRLCRDIVLTNEGIGVNEKDAYRLEDGDYKLKKFFVIERIFNTHIIYKGVYSLFTELELKSDFVDIPYHEVSSRSQDRQLAQLLKSLSQIRFYTLEESSRFNTWCPVSVRGFASTTGLPFSTVFEYCFTHFILRDPLAPELVKLKESYLHDLEADFTNFKNKLLDAIDSIQTAKELILEGVHDLTSLLLRLMEERGGSIAITPDVIRILQSYGYSIECAVEALDKLAIEGRVKKHPDRWELCR